MGDKSPKSVNKQAAQKLQAKASVAAQKKTQADAAKAAPKKK
jgi:hypothetical protein